MSLTRPKRASLTGERKKKHVFLESLLSLALCFNLVRELLFDCSRVLEYAKIRTVLQSSVWVDLLIPCLAFPRPTLLLYKLKIAKNGLC